MPRELFEHRNLTPVAMATSIAMATPFHSSGPASWILHCNWMTTDAVHGSLLLWEGHAMHIIAASSVYQLLINDIHEARGSASSTMSEWLVFLLLLRAACIMATDTSYTLRAPDAVMTMPSWEAVVKGGFEFRFRTSQHEATLLYTEHPSNGYLWLRLYRGSLLLSLNQTKPGNVGQVDLSLGSALNDDNEHIVQVQQQSRLRLRLVCLDDPLSCPRDVAGSHMSAIYLHSTTMVYMGGVPSDVTAVSSAVQTYPHFSGCIREVLFGNDTYSFINYDYVKPLWTISSSTGCSPPCEGEMCNGGHCLNHWEENAAVCDCSLTHRVGKQCTQGESWCINISTEPVCGSQ